MGEAAEEILAQENPLDDIFLDTLKDIYSAERQTVRALPKMAKAAQSPNLKAHFEKHLAESGVHVERLEQVFGFWEKLQRLRRDRLAAARRI
jgi:ferritin-like metal-binding protein YciE